MAKSFSTKDAKSILKAHNDITEKLKKADTVVRQYRQRVKDASDTLVKKEADNMLNSIPVEEINREKNGIRVKLLRDKGYNTIADLNKASVHTLAMLNGISDDGAVQIKKIVGEIAERTQKEAKLRLSADKRTSESTALVSALLKYRRALSICEKCRSLLSYEKAVASAEKNLKASLGGVKWLFATKAERKKAEDAFDFLNELLNGSYGTEANECISESDKLESLSDSEAWLEFSADSIAFYNTLEEINPGVLGNDDSIYGLPEELAKEIQNEQFYSEGLRCTLRRYQEWGVKYALHQKKSLLGDEMGLGKTVQAIAVMVSLRNTGGTHFLVVCPASVITNWCREITKMSDLEVTKIHGENRLASFESWRRSGGVAVTTYETTAFLKFPELFKFALMVVDEAHYIKNPEARRSVNVKNICTHAEKLLFMTGTALENNVDEMISLIKVLQPDTALKIGSMTYLSSAPQFREAVAPVYYRRKRSDVLTELPEKTESKEWCTMTKKEEEAYEKAVLSKNFAEARRVSWNVSDLKDSSKAARLSEIAQEAESEDRKVIVFSFFLDTLKKVCTLLGDRCTQPITGSVSPARRQEIIDEFGKAPAGTVLVAQIQSGGTGLNIQSASVVVFCEPQFKPSIENQAISRAYRMGQTRNVLVYRLLCDDTVDEKIVSILEKKQTIFDAFADESVTADESLELDENTFSGIMREERDRINAKNSTDGNNTEENKPDNTDKTGEGKECT